MLFQVSARIGVNGHNFYRWVKQRSSSATRGDQRPTSQHRRLKTKLKRVTEERYIPIKANVVSTGQRSAWRVCRLVRLNEQANVARFLGDLHCFIIAIGTG